jgi:maltodextrin utilization protein YvdJ
MGVVLARIRGSDRNLFGRVGAKWLLAVTSHASVDGRSSTLETKRKVAMPIIKLHKSNEAGEETGILFVNTDQIVVITAGLSTTEVQMTDGHTRWVKETPESVAALAQTP